MCTSFGSEPPSGSTYSKVIRWQKATDAKSKGYNGAQDASNLVWRRRQIDDEPQLSRQVPRCPITVLLYLLLVPDSVRVYRSSNASHLSRSLVFPSLWRLHDIFYEAIRPRITCALVCNDAKTRTCGGLMLVLLYKLSIGQLDLSPYGNAQWLDSTTSLASEDAYTLTLWMGAKSNVFLFDFMLPHVMWSTVSLLMHK